MDNINIIMDKFNIKHYGICDFKKVNATIPCSKSKFLPTTPKSVITCLFPYYTNDFPNRNVSRYAIPNDYHDIVSKILNDICDELKNAYNSNFTAFCDISPIDEKACAKICELGFIGKNGLLINKDYGTYFFIGEIVTDVYFPQIISSDNKSLCTSCNLCIKNCPANAISEDGVNYEFCASNLTQKKRELTKDEENIIKASGLAWGCDICQDICPHNSKPKPSEFEEFFENLSPILNAENIDELIKVKAYGYKGKKLLMRNLDIIKNNKKLF